MSNTYNGLTIQIPTEDFANGVGIIQGNYVAEDYNEPESIRQEGQGSFKIEERQLQEERMSGKKRKAEGFSNDLPVQSNRNQPIGYSK